ncbi:MAG: methyltransferase domain-containing protein [archaeon]
MRQILQGIKKRGKRYRLLDLGAGSGTTINDIATELEKRRLLGNVELYATGVKLMPEWKSLPNAAKIKWMVTHTNNLAERFLPNSIDFVNANYSLAHSQNKEDAFLQIHRILRKGGRIIYSFNHNFLNKLPRIPKGFKAVKGKPQIKMSDPSEDTNTVTVVYYLEKK